MWSAVRSSLCLLPLLGCAAAVSAKEAPPVPVRSDTVYRCEVNHGRVLGGVVALVDVRGDGTRINEEQILGFSTGNRGAPGMVTGYLNIKYLADDAISIDFGSKEVPDPIDGHYAQLRLIGDDGREVARLVSHEAKDRFFDFPVNDLLQISGQSEKLATEVILYDRSGTPRTTFVTAPLFIAKFRRAIPNIEPVKRAVDHIVDTSIAEGTLAENCSPIDSTQGNYVHTYRCYIRLTNGRDKVRVDESSGMLDRKLDNAMRFTAEFVHHDPERFLNASLVELASFGELRVMGQYYGPDRGISYVVDRRYYYPPVVAVDLIAPERSYRDWGQNYVRFVRNSVSIAIGDTGSWLPNASGYIPTKIAAYRPNGEWLAQEELDWTAIEAEQKELLRDVLAMEANPVGTCEFSKTLMNDPNAIVIIN